MYEIVTLCASRADVEGALRSFSILRGEEDVKEKLHMTMGDCCFPYPLANLFFSAKCVLVVGALHFCCAPLYCLGVLATCQLAI